MRRATKTLNQLTFQFTEEKLTYSAEDFPANRLVMEDTEGGWMTPDTFGLKCLGLYERFAQRGSWERTFMDLLIGMKGWSSTRLKMTWEMKVTKSSRLYCQLQVLTHRTSEKEYSLLPTPTARDYKGGKSIEAMKRRRERGIRALTLPDVFALHGRTSQLSPRFVMEMMGFPNNWTILPFKAGEQNHL